MVTRSDTKNTNGVSVNYTWTKHRIIARLIAIWRVVTCRNFILIDYSECIKDGERCVNQRSLHGSEYEMKVDPIDPINPSVVKVTYIISPQTEE